MVTIAAALPATAAVGEAGNEAAEEAAFERAFRAAGTAHVSGGELRFLADAPERDVHQHLNSVVIDTDSLASGWVRLEQCHRNLDPVQRAQILFRLRPYI